MAQILNIIWPGSDVAIHVPCLVGDSVSLSGRQVYDDRRLKLGVSIESTIPWNKLSSAKGYKNVDWHQFPLSRQTTAIHCTALL